MRRQLGMVLSLILLLAIGETTFGATPKKEVETVYSLFLNNGQKYVTTFSRQTGKEIYLLSGVDHILSPTKTLVYYWPISDEYLADWMNMNQKFTGKLKISGPNHQTRVIEKTTYSLLSDRNSGDDSYQLLTGNKALEQYNQFLKDSDRYWEESLLFSKLQAEYSRKYEAFLANPLKQKAPVEPIEPQAVPYQLSQPDQAFILNLPEGEYRCVMIDQNNREIPVTQRKLIVFSERRSGIGYQIIPERKWTNSVETNRPEETLYVSSGSQTLFINAFESLEYNEYFLDRLHRLQVRGSTGASRERWIWLKGQAADQHTLEIIVDHKVVQRLNPKPFSVVQSPGTALGYEIKAFQPVTGDPTHTPSFTAYAIKGRFQPGHRYEIRLVDAAGKEIVQSRRRIVPVRDLSQVPIFPWVIFLPLVSVVGWRINGWWQRQRSTPAI